MTINRLESIYLRANGIDDKGMERICENLKNSNVKCLDLSMNCFTADSITFLADAIKENAALEYLGLAYLKLTFTDFKPLLDEFGSFNIEPEELNELKQKIKERDAIVAKNARSKGKKIEPVPNLPSIVQGKEGNELVLKNEGFKQLNLGLNNINESELEEIDKVLARTPSTFTLILTGTHITQENAKSLITRYGERVVV